MLIHVPALAPRVPKRGGPVTRTLGRLLMSLAGWRFEGAFPDLPRFVIVVGPHTSNWDFAVGILAVFALGLRAGFIGKHTLFWWPFSVWLRYMGGVPVDRSAPQGVVEEIVRQFGVRDAFLVAITPSGTRRLGAKWKLGFYRIARGAGVPIVPVAFDYASRAVRIGPPFSPTGGLPQDLDPVRAFFTGVQGRRGAPCVPNFEAQAG